MVDSVAYREPLTLWRGGDLLGEVVAHLPTQHVGAIHGLLRPTAAFSDIGHLLQTRHTISPDAPVFLARFDEDTDPGPRNLRQLTPEEAKGLPLEAQLVVRDATGRALPLDLISIDSYQVPDGQGPMPDLCRQHGIVGVAWLLAAFPPRHG